MQTPPSCSAHRQGLTHGQICVHAVPLALPQYRVGGIYRQPAVLQHVNWGFTNITRLAREGPQSVHERQDGIWHASLGRNPTWGDTAASHVRFLAHHRAMQERTAGS